MQRRGSVPAIVSQGARTGTGQSCDLCNAETSMSLVLGPHEPVGPDEGAPTIREVRAYVIAGSKEIEKAAGGGADCHSQADDHWIVGTPIANPMSGFAAFKSNRTSWGIDAIGSVICEVELSTGEVGVGIAVGGEPACHIIERHLARFVEGQDPRNVELIWDQCWRSTINYGRKGLPVQALSALDLAIWDALGKLRREPVYNLLGGKTKARLPLYSTSTRPDCSKRLGFFGGKFPLPYGPGDGDAGMRANIERIKAVRASVGPDFPLMLDCYMSLTVPYTVELARRIDREVPGGVKWIEEALPPDDYEGYAEVKRKVGHLCMITCGEHEYTRYGFRQLLERKCCDVLQPDITWCGGITEARRICALAAAHDIMVIPHGSSVYSYHLQLAFPNCPIAEFLNMSPNADKIVPYFGKTFVDEPLPSGGYVDVDPSKYGFGVTLNRALELRRPFPHEPAALSREMPKQEAWLRAWRAIPAPRAATRLEFFDPHFHVWDLNVDADGRAVSGHDATQLFAPEGDARFSVDEYEACFGGIVANTPSGERYDVVHTGGVFVEAMSVCFVKDNFSSMTPRAAGEASWAAADLARSSKTYVIVGSASLESPDAASALSALVESAGPTLRGVRQIVNFEPSWPRNAERGSDLLTDPTFVTNLGLLSNLGLSFDLQCNPCQYTAAAKAFRTYPNTTVVLNHMGCIKADQLDSDATWEGLKMIAALPNPVYVKLSMLCYAHPAWDESEEVISAMHRVIEIFGIERCFFASNAPVDAKDGWTAARTLRAFVRVAVRYGERGMRMLFSENAKRAYRVI